MRKLNQFVDRVLDRVLRQHPAHAQQCYLRYESCTGCNCCAPKRTRRHVFLICGDWARYEGYVCC